VKAKATKRAMAMATRMASDDKGNCDSNKGGGRATATRAMAVATTVVGKDEGGGNGDEVGGRQRGWGRHGDGNNEKYGRQATATATKRAVAMVMKVVGKDEGDGKSSRSNGNGKKEGNYRKKAMASNNGNETMATEITTTQQIQRRWQQ
jgi:hypothetical protein